MRAIDVSAFKRAAMFQKARAIAVGLLELTASVALFDIRQSNGETPNAISLWNRRATAAAIIEAASSPM